MLIHAEAAYDPRGRLHRPAAVELRPGHPPRFGHRRDFAAGADTRDLPRALVLPGLVNAHTHLELNAIGPRPHPGGGFVGWVRMVRRCAARRGAGNRRCALPGGVAAVGDITSDIPADRAGEHHDGEPTHAVASYLELFGLGDPFDRRALATIAARRAPASADPPRAPGAPDAATWPPIGLQPHAPYSAGPAVYAAATDAAVAAGLPLSTHLAESPQEMRFVAQAAGPLRDYLRELGKWDDAFAASYRDGLSPVQWMKPYLKRAPWLLAHCNFVDDADIQTLAAAGASVAYCPIASDYFGHRAAGPGHRYREMLAAGVNVCLGTDSVICQPPGEPQPLGILPQMRYLYRRDRTDPATLLAMAGARGVAALRLPHAPAAVTAVAFDPACSTDPLEQVLTSDAPAATIGPAAPACCSPLTHHESSSHE